MNKIVHVYVLSTCHCRSTLRSSGYLSLSKRVYICCSMYLGVRLYSLEPLCLVGAAGISAEQQQRSTPKFCQSGCHTVTPPHGSRLTSYHGDRFAFLLCETLLLVIVL